MTCKHGQQQVLHSSLVFIGHPSEAVEGVEVDKV